MPSAVQNPFSRISVANPAVNQPWWLRHWFALAAAIIAAAPGLASLARNYWSTEQGAAGPIVLMSGLWLLWHETRHMALVHERIAGAVAPLGIALFGLFAVVAAVTAKQWLQLLGIYAALTMLLYAVLGRRQLLRLWAPIAYLAFVIPPPDNLIVPLTHRLKGAVANGSVGLLDMLGYPVAREGVLLYIGSYELVVAAACSGMNSLVSLTAIGIFYVYLLHRARWPYALLLAVLMVPVALFANMVRVILLMLMTYHFGDEVAQGLLHEVAGLFIFVVALLTLVVLDTALAPLLVRRGGHSWRR